MFVPLLIALQSSTVGETCPAGIDVEARVRGILHLAPEQQLEESFGVERREAGLYVTLKAADASTIGERTLPLEGTCDELAQAAAVVLSAWLTDVHPDFAGALPPGAPAEAAPEPPPEPAPEPPPEPKPAAPRAQPAPRPAPRGRAGSLDAALGAGADLTSGAVAPAAFVAVGYGAIRSGLGAHAFGFVTMPRERALGPGRIAWRRWPLGAGPSFRVGSSSAAWDFAGGPVVAWLHLDGRDFEREASVGALNWGGFFNVRVAGRAEPFAPFGLLSLQVYPGKAVAHVENLDREWRLPVFSLALAFGARWSL